MSKFNNGLELSTQRHPIHSAGIILILAFLGFLIIGPMIGFLFGFPFFDGSLAEYTDLFLGGDIMNSRFKTPAFVMQGTASTIGFILIPLLAMIIYEKQTVMVFFKTKKTTNLLVLLTVFIGISFIGFNSLFVEWNAGLTLPEFMSGFESWARNFEDLAMRQTEFFTRFDSNAQFALAFFVIAIIPGIGEELVFRGFLQNYLHKSSRNIHIAIWVSAFLFSAMHMQFFGLVPRMMLGALFGYLYFWSGNLIIPIVAHIVNNGFTLIMMYVYQAKITDLNIESVEEVSLVSFSIFAIITFSLLFVFRWLNLTSSE